MYEWLFKLIYIWFCVLYYRVEVLFIKLIELLCKCDVIVIFGGVFMGDKVFIVLRF